MTRRLVAIHGFGGRGADFDLLRPALPALITPDLDLPDFQLPAHLTGPDVILLGYSMGARVALDRALSGPLGGLILVGATAGIADPEAREARQRRDQTLAAQIEALGASRFAETWAQTPLIATQRHMPEPFRTAMARRRGQEPVHRLTGMLHRWGQGTYRPRWMALSTLECPVWVITGAQDPKYTAIAARLAAKIPRATALTVPGAGHAPHLERPARFLAHLSKALADLQYHPLHSPQGAP